MMYVFNILEILPFQEYQILCFHFNSKQFLVIIDIIYIAQQYTTVKLETKLNFLLTNLLNSLISSLVRRRARESENESDESRCDWCVRICSENNFPTAAGLASSAAGYACLGK